ncbi:MAG: D-glycero-beta-D-manno-heptose-7-phosphate kinase [bacterium]|nr:D-glycero-beta-D-manno-heptose-7-phosphate kinase [bacterium]
MKGIDINQLRHVIAGFKSTKVLVVGDLMLDRFVWGTVERISPEAPVPVVKISSESIMMGGASNVANNICALGAEALITGIIGDDIAGEEFLQLVKKQGMNEDGIILSKKRPTIVKTRIIAQHQQVVRTDKEFVSQIKSTEAKRILAYIKSNMREISAIVISDYGKGIVTRYLVKQIIKLNREFNYPIIVDPIPRHLTYYKNVTMITPNNHEAGESLKTEIKDEQSLVRVGKSLLKLLQANSILITRGEKGMSLFERDGKVANIPTVAKEVFDVTGAGDTVVGVLALCLGNKASMYESAYIANHAAGIVVGKLGTATVSIDELRKSME